MLWKRYSAQLSELKGRELQRDQTSPSRGMVVQLLLPQGCHKSAAAAVCLSPWLMQRSFTGADFVQLWFCWHTPSCSFFCQGLKKNTSTALPCKVQNCIPSILIPWFLCRRLISILLLQSPGLLHGRQFLSTERNHIPEYISAPDPLQMP